MHLRADYDALAYLGTQALVINTSFGAAEAALVTPLYRGRLGSTPAAISLRGSLERIIELTYLHAIEEDGAVVTDLSAEDKELREANMVKVPFPLAVKLNLIDALGDCHQFTSARGKNTGRQKITIPRRSENQALHTGDA